MTQNEKKLLFLLQKGLPLAPHPLAALGAECGIPESGAVAFVERLFKRGAARRLGAVFDARRLGYSSALCAVSVVGRRELARAGCLAAACAGVTHCYERGWPAELPENQAGGPKGQSAPNLWFTLAAPASRFDVELSRIRCLLAPLEIIELPAVRRFKIDVVFDLRSRRSGESAPSLPRGNGGKSGVETCNPEFSGHEKNIVRLLQGNIPDMAAPYQWAARELGMRERDLLATLKKWLRQGVLRRFALLVKHQRVGFKANAMCVWRVDARAVIEAGRQVAACPDTTHCYQRPPMPGFDYNLYAMLHGRMREQTRRIFMELTKKAGLPPGRILYSLREFKKTSMVYFSDEKQNP